MLDLKTRAVGDVTVLDADGSMVSGLGLEGLRPLIERLVADQQRKIVLNVRGVSVIDSRGVGDLVAGFSLLKKHGGALKVACPSKIVREVLRVAQLPRIIEIHDSEEDAVKSFVS